MRPNERQKIEMIPKKTLMRDAICIYFREDGGATFRRYK